METDKTLGIIASIALFYFLVATAFYIPYYDDSFFKDGFREGGAYEELGEEKTDDIYHDLRTYLDEDYFGYDRMHLLSEFSPDEQSHLKDVKVLIDWVCILYYIAIAIIIGFMIFFSRKEGFKKRIGEVLFGGGAAAMGFILLLGVFALADFTTFWNYFHQALFPQGNWMFPSDSLLVTLFLHKPHHFFQDFVQRFAIYTVLLSGVSLALGHYLKKITS